MDPILNTIPYPTVILWDNSLGEDLKTYGRYQAALASPTEAVYFQDDDTIQTNHGRLMQRYKPGMTTAVYGHGAQEAGYGDLPLVCGGALAHRSQIQEALRIWDLYFDRDEDFLYDCDFALGPLIPFQQVRLPFMIRDVAYNGRRLADQPWQREAKLRITNRARWIRDHEYGPSLTDSMPVPGRSGTRTGSVLG